MGEYIEKEAFKQYLLDLKKQVNDILPGQSVISGTTLSELVDRFPAAADVQKVRHGRWQLTKSGYWYECSLCGCVPDNYPFKYCPNCGADMKDGVEE